MAELIAHGQSIETIFDLIGDLENDITKSIVWSFKKCPKLLEKCVEKLLGITINADEAVIRYQVSEADKGITDLEITDNRNFYIIIEAKRGWIFRDMTSSKCILKGIALLQILQGTKQ